MTNLNGLIQLSTGHGSDVACADHPKKLRALQVEQGRASDFAASEGL